MRQEDHAVDGNSFHGLIVMTVNLHGADSGFCGNHLVRAGVWEGGKHAGLRTIHLLFS